MNKRLTRKECMAILEDPHYKEYNCAIIFFRDEIINAVDKRVIWAENYAESLMWVEQQATFYKEHDIPFAAYIRGAYFYSNGTLFTDGDCKDE